MPSPFSCALSFAADCSLASYIFFSKYLWTKRKRKTEEKGDSRCGGNPIRLKEKTFTQVLCFCSDSLRSPRPDFFFPHAPQYSLYPLYGSTSRVFLTSFHWISKFSEEILSRVFVVRTPHDDIVGVNLRASSCPDIGCSTGSSLKNKFNFWCKTLFRIVQAFEKWRSTFSFNYSRENWKGLGRKGLSTKISKKDIII